MKRVVRRARARRHVVDRGEVLSDRQVGERLGLRAREVRRLFARVEIALGRKLRRYFWRDVLDVLEQHRGNGVVQ